MPLMPLTLANGNEALRMMDMFGYTPQESSMLFVATSLFDQYPLEGRALFARLEFNFESLMALERRFGRHSEAFERHAMDIHWRIDDLMMELATLLKKQVPPPLKNYRVLAG